MREDASHTGTNFPVTTLPERGVDDQRPGTRYSERQKHCSAIHTEDDCADATAVVSTASTSVTFFTSAYRHCPIRPVRIDDCDPPFSRRTFHVFQRVVALRFKNQIDRRRVRLQAVVSADNGPDNSEPMATPQEAATTITDEVQRLSGRGVRVIPDPSLKVHSTMKTARGDAPFHVIAYNPKLAAHPEYLIAFQCGFLLRLFTTPPEQRVDFASRAGAAETISKEVSTLLPPGTPSQVATQFASQLFSGLLLQIRSVPVGLRVDAWLAEEFPTLHALQRQQVERQLAENVQPLSGEFKAFVPRNIYLGSLAINAAFAAFWARVWNQPALLLPYRAAGHADRGARLLSEWDDIDHAPPADRTLMDAWATAIEVQDWYEWVPFQSVP